MEIHFFQVEDVFRPLHVGERSCDVRLSETTTSLKRLLGSLSNNYGDGNDNDNG